MTEGLALAARLAVLVVAGITYVSLLGAALTPWLMPRAWAPYRMMVVPFLGWAALVGVAYPLNAALPGRPVLVALGGLALVAFAAQVATRRSFVGVGWRAEALWAPCVAGVLTLVSAVPLYAGAGTLSALVADSDVEHFADVVGALLTYPIGWSAEAQMGLEATPIGLAYHYLHAATSAVTGVDPFGTAMASHLAMVALAPAGAYLFVREVLGGGRRAAAGAALLSACGGLGLGIAGFGWGQQTAALATVPAGLAGLRRALVGGTVRDVAIGGLLASLAAGSLHLATAPLLGATAMACAALVAPRLGIAVVVRRLFALGGVVLTAGALSHLSTAVYFLRGGLASDDMRGRSTHVREFASLPEALALAPLDLFAGGASHGTDFTAIATTCAVLASLTGLWVARREPLVLGIVGAVVSLELYLRLIRPFPYGEFKVVTSIWCVVPALAATGVDALMRSRPRLGPLWLAGVLVFGVGLGITQIQIRRTLSDPWGAVLPESEMDALRRVVRAVPIGAAVWVSNQLAPEAAIEWSGRVTDHRAGFPSREAGAGYLANRWRGAATALLAYSGRPVYGLVQRHSTELRSPAAPLDADFVLLDVSEDALFYGLTQFELVAQEGRLRLYRATGGLLPASHLPIGESLPGRRQGYDVPRRQQPIRPAHGETYVALALWAANETEVELRPPSPGRARRMALFPGMTWYVSVFPDVAVVVNGDVDVSVVARRPLRPGTWMGGEQLVRSPAGIEAPAVLLTAEGAAIDVRYINLSAQMVTTAARLRSGERMWLGGRAASPSASLDPPVSVYRLPSGASGQLWLDIGPDGRAAVHAPPVGGLYTLPLLGRLAVPPAIQEGTLVKGSSARLHFMLDGRLRWAPSLDALQRRGPIPRLIALRDEELWRLPVGLPLE